MKILIYAAVFHPAVGGIENLTLALAHQFRKNGHEVKVVTEQAQQADAPLEGIEVIHSRSGLAQVKLFLWCDVVYMPNITLKGIWLFLFNPFKKWVISHNDFHLSNTTGWKTWLKNLVIRGTSRNLSVSHSVAGTLPVPSKVIHNCYDEQVFRIYAEERREVDFLFVGRLVSQKGCEMLIEACGRLRKPFQLSIVGEGEEYPKLRARVSALGLGERISFLGVQQGKQLARTMNRHRVMIVPSIGAEGFGIVALEGLACGCRMVVSDAGGLPEAIGAFGSVFPMGDVDALAALLDERLSQPLAVPASNARQAHLEAHYAPIVARQYLDFFD